MQDASPVALLTAIPNNTRFLSEQKTKRVTKPETAANSDALSIKDFLLLFSYGFPLTAAKPKYPLQASECDLGRRDA